MRPSTGTTCIGIAFTLALGAIGCAPTPAPPTTPAPPSAQQQASATPASLQDRPAAAANALAPAANGRPISASAAPAAMTPSEADIIAHVGTHLITKDQLLAPMLEAHGLSFLLHLAQLELAQQAAQAQSVAVTADDFKEERRITFKRMFEESDAAIRDKIREAKENKDNATVQKLEAELNADKESLLTQFLQQQYVQSHQYVSRQEFDLLLQTNAYLRKIAEASPQLKNAVTDEMVKKQFGAQFGEKIVVRHIQATSAADLQEAKNRLAKGENFADVAKAMSTNKNTGPLGGAVPPFTINAPNVPKAFRDMAFSLKIGEVSDPVESDGAYHLIKVENHIAPKAVKFEAVQAAIRADLYEQILRAAVSQLREKLSRQLIANLKIEKPTLKAQYEKRLEEDRVRQQEQIDAAMKRGRAPTAEDAAAPEAPATAPSSQPAKGQVPGSTSRPVQAK